MGSELGLALEGLLLWSHELECRINHAKAR